jgi:hypothetical protein
MKARLLASARPRAWVGPAARPRTGSSGDRGAHTADKIREFLAKVGRVKAKADNWKDYYFGDVDKLTD